MKLKFVVAAILATSSMPAMAQTFTGPRIEGRAAWHEMTIEASVDGQGDSDSREAVTFGAEAGYDFQLGTSAVVGGYVGVDFDGPEACEEVFGMDQACLSDSRNITVGVRAGVPVASTVLLYAKGGYSNMRLRLDYEDFEDIIDDFSDSESVNGVHVGAGVELAAGPNVYVKAEYVYTMYDGSSDTIDGAVFEADINRQQALVGVGFRF